MSGFFSIHSESSINGIDLGRSMDVGHLLSPQGRLSTLVCSVFLRNQEGTVQSPGGYIEWRGGSPRAWEGGVWIPWESSTYQTQPELSPPARRCGRTPVPCPVCLSDWLSCQLFHRQMQTCQGGKQGPVGAGETHCQSSLSSLHETILTRSAHILEVLG